MKTYLKILSVLPIAFTATVCFVTSASALSASGIITDENDEPMIGVHVAVLPENGSITSGVITDLDGNFNLTNIPDKSRLQIKYVGYEEQTVTPSENMNIKMNPDSQKDDTFEQFETKIPEGSKCSVVPITQGTWQTIDGKRTCVPTSCANGYTLLNGSCIDEQAEQKYKEAKEKEQSMANRALTAATTAATGIGGMELAMGLSQQKADKEADADMAAYLETFRCTYGDGKSVKGGTTEIELPGGNDQTMMNYRAEYLALADDLKIRKAALGMAPGIESEIIMDKAAMGLYDDENVGINGGNYESLYRAKMLDSEEDQAKIDANAQAAKNRVIAGAVVGGVGVVGGIVGDSLINGKLGEKIKEAKENKNRDNADKEALKQLRTNNDQNVLLKTEVCTEYNGDYDQYYAKEANGREEGVSELGTLLNNQWIVKLSWGEITGRSVCTSNYTTSEMTSFAAGDPGNQPGEWCWCKSDSYTKDGTNFGISSNWYLNRTLPINSSCKGLCASYCAIAIQKNPYKRALILNKGEDFCSNPQEEEYNLTNRNIDIEKTPTSGKALSLSNKCYTTDNSDTKWKRLPNTNACKDTPKGEWNLSFNWGNVTGTSLCSDTEGERKYELGTLETNKNKGSNCWCKEINSAEKSIYWVYDHKYQTDQDCSDMCAHSCALRSQEDPYFRGMLLGIRPNDYLETYEPSE